MICLARCYLLLGNSSRTVIEAASTVVFEGVKELSRISLILLFDKTRMSRGPGYEEML